MIEIPLTRGHVAIVDDADADLAAFKWTASQGARKAGVYAVRWMRRDGKVIALPMHRMILESKLMRELRKDEVCDHIDRNPLNNRRDNLRACSYSENARNRSSYFHNTQDLILLANQLSCDVSEIIFAAIEETGNQLSAANLLGIAPNTVRYHLKKHNKKVTQVIIARVVDAESEA